MNTDVYFLKNWETCCHAFIAIHTLKTGITIAGVKLTFLPQILDKPLCALRILAFSRILVVDSLSANML